MGFFDKFKHKDATLDKINETEKKEACSKENNAELAPPPVRRVRPAPSQNFGISTREGRPNFDYYIYAVDQNGNVNLFETITAHSQFDKQIEIYFDLKFNKEGKQPDFCDEVYKEVFSINAITKKEDFISVIQVLNEHNEIGISIEIRDILQKMQNDDNIIAVAFNGEWNNYNINEGTKHHFVELKF